MVFDYMSIAFSQANIVVRSYLSEALALGHDFIYSFYHLFIFCYYLGPIVWKDFQLGSIRLNVVLYVYDISPYFETEAKQNYITFRISYLNNQKCSLAFALSIIAM